MKIVKRKNDVFQGISTNTNGTGNKIKTIEISHQRTRTPGAVLTEIEVSIFRSEIEKLTRIARMARPDLRYDVFEAAHPFTRKETINMDPKSFISKEGSKREVEKEKEEGFCHIPGFLNSQQEGGKGVNRVSLLGDGIKEEKKSAISYTAQNLILLKRQLGN